MNVSISLKMYASGGEKCIIIKSDGLQCSNKLIIILKLNFETSKMTDILCMFKKMRIKNVSPKSQKSYKT